MSKFAPVPTPLEIDDVQSARVAAGETRLTLSGRWLAADAPSTTDEPLLVVQVEGRRHRFTPEAGTDTGSDAAAWRASFVVPAWAEPQRAGQAAVWVGDAVIPLPAMHGGRGGWARGAPPALAAAVPADAPESSDASLAEAPPEPEAAGSEREVAPEHNAVSGPAMAPGPDVALEPGVTPRSGPLAALLLKETVAALHVELEQRGAEAAQLRSALAETQYELEARGGTQAELESTLGQLGAELRRLMEAVEEQRRELERRDSDAERERAEYEQRLAELSGARQQDAAEVGVLHERLAEAEARFQRRSAEIAGLREELASVTVSREAARTEAAGLKSELQRLGTELAVTRERVVSEAGDLGEANRLLADAKALAAELRAQQPDST